MTDDTCIVIMDAEEANRPRADVVKNIYYAFITAAGVVGLLGCEVVAVSVALVTPTGATIIYGDKIVTQYALLITGIYFVCVSVFVLACSYLVEKKLGKDLGRG